MKKLFILLVIILSCASIPPEQLQQQDIIAFEGMNKLEIYKNSLEWIASSFNSYKAVTEYTDPESGKIIGNFTIIRPFMLGRFIFLSQLTIEIKDGRSRLTFIAKNLYWNNINNEYSFEKNSKKLYLESISSLKSSYIDFIKNKNRDNW